MSLHAVPDAFLSDAFGRAVYRVERAGPAPSAGLPAGFYWAKVRTEDVAMVKQLVGAGFSVVDVNVVFAAAPSALSTRIPADVEVQEGVSEAHAPAVLEIAATAFRYSRFHLDPDIPNEVASRVKREWVANYIRGARGDRLFVAWRGGRPLGFLSALKTEQAAVIDLIGVATDAQGAGLGRSLVAAFALHYGETYTRLEVGTQVANVASVAFYEALGFRLSRSQYVLHAHFEGAPEN